MSRKKKLSKTDEEIREIILKFLYDIHQKSGSRTRSRLKLTDIKKQLKIEKLSAKEIVRNLDYLIQNGWVVEEIEHYQFQKGRIIIPGERRYYKISSSGIDHFQGPSKFQSMQKKYSGININNIQGIIQLGDGNYVNVEFKDLYQSLSSLNEEIRRNSSISDKEKLDYQAEIETIKSQLSKSSPNKEIISKAWANLEKLATLEGAIELIQKIKTFILPLLG